MAGKHFVFTGSFDRDTNPVGVGSFIYDSEKNELKKAGTFGRYENMSNIVVDGDLLIASAEGMDTDAVCSFRILGDGTLEEINELHTGCKLQAHIFMDRERHFILVSSMGSACVVMIDYTSDGRLTIVDKVVFDDPGSTSVGRSSNPRQKNSRIHAAFVTPDRNHVHVCNLGSDKIYTLEIKDGKLTRRDELTVDVAGGAGPRHAVYSGEYVFFNMELENKIYSYHINADYSLEPIGRFSALDPLRENPPKGELATSVVSADGRFLLCANRGQNNIARFRINRDGTLTPVSFSECEGVCPRGITLAGGGRLLLCSNNISGTLTIFECDEKEAVIGKCVLTEPVLAAANAVCIDC